MPKIASIKIDWHEGWGNSPSFVVTWDAKPDTGKLIYQKRETPEGITYLGIDGEYANFAHWSPTNQTGYGGRECAFRTQEGIEIRKGPWSGNSAWINELWPLSRVVEVNWSYFAGAATEEGVIRACREIGIPLAYVQPKSYPGEKHLQPLRPTTLLAKNSEDYILIQRLC